MSSNHEPLLGRTKLSQGQFRPGGIDCYCCNPYLGKKHGSKSARDGRKRNKRHLRRTEKQMWRKLEDSPES